MVISPRVLARLFLLCASLTVLVPREAHAIPVIDWKANLKQAMHMVGRIGDGYIIARQWRDKALGKAEAMIEHVEELVQKRQQYEQMAYGEMAGIGKGLPNWRDFTDPCKIDAQGKSICEVYDEIGKQIDDVILDTLRHFRGEVFATLDSSKVELHAMVGAASGNLGKHMLEGVALAESGFLSATADERFMLGQRFQLLQGRLEAAKGLDTLSRLIHFAVDSLIQKEDLDNSVTSGRAVQITTHMKWLQSKVNMEMTEERMFQLESDVVDVLERVHEARELGHARTRPIIF